MSKIVIVLLLVFVVGDLAQRHRRIYRRRGRSVGEPSYNTDSQPDPEYTIPLFLGDINLEPSKQQTGLDLSDSKPGPESSYKMTASAVSTPDDDGMVPKIPPSSIHLNPSLSPSKHRK
ncbi:unnamed protein product [Danaus chrysippus]|uniref:(African queen) hypothetical protein n=1 Tax=Danaus chrysippus TaxID=151541 RepID=A0A8J2RAA3_9NEOP|nr:unnamed protein product [Danaus chrysippus]